MRSLIFFLLSVIICVIGHGQTSVKSVNKPSLTISDLGKWPSVESPKINGDGKYAMYTYRQGEEQSLVIKATEGLWEKWIKGASSNSAFFTENGQFVIVQVKDSLYIIRLSINQEVFVGISSFKTPVEGTGEWIAYRLNGPEKTLVLRNLLTGKENKFPSTTDYLFNNAGTVLLVKAQVDKDSSSLQLYSLKTGKATAVWRGIRAGNFCMEAASSSLGFIGEDPKDSKQNALWYYKVGMDSAIVLADKESEGIEKDLSIRGDQLRFNKDGSKLFFYLEPPAIPKPSPGYVSVDVWSWSDTRLQSQQLFEKGRPIKYMSVININEGKDKQASIKIIRLEQEEGDQVINQVDKMKADYVLLQFRTGDMNEFYWNKASFISVYLVNTKDGSRKLLKDSIKFWTPFYSISPEEKFVINYDVENRNYFSYEIGTGIKRNLTEQISVPLNYSNSDNFVYTLSNYGIANWVSNDASLFIYDEYDIWKIDPLNKESPVNLTNGYGRLNNLKFRTLNDEQILSLSKNSNSFLTVTAFNTITKEIGFYTVQLNAKIIPLPLSIGPYLNQQGTPIKAKKANTYLIGRQTSSEVVNYFTTKDFKTFKILSNVVSPNRSFNWYTTELITWKTFDGSESQGILYKPSNFDSTRKYPVIFNFYEIMSNNLNEFLDPGFSYGKINVPYYVSNGYLVFRPDIHFKIGEAGESILNSVVSIAKHLSKIPWIDSTKMGLQGFSFGGYGVNYLVTHTNIFAAAVAASGVSNEISAYGDLRVTGVSRQNLSETDQRRLGSTLWQKPDVYIKNSPIFYVDKVITPLLILSNKKDGQVPFAQGLEMFLAMRRLGKKCWMLQYDNAGHGLDYEIDKKDFTIRMKQFFDHYLKDAPAAKWLTKGVPAVLKGVETGLLLEERN